MKSGGVKSLEVGENLEKLLETIKKDLNIGELEKDMIFLYNIVMSIDSSSRLYLMR